MRILDRCPIGKSPKCPLHLGDSCFILAENIPTSYTTMTRTTAEAADGSGFVTVGAEAASSRLSLSRLCQRLHDKSSLCASQACMAFITA